MYCEGCGARSENQPPDKQDYHRPPPEGIPHCVNCCLKYYKDCPEAIECIIHEWDYEIESVEIEGQVLYLTRTCMKINCKVSQPALISIKESDFDKGEETK